MYATHLYQPTMCTPNKDGINMLYSFTKLNNAYRSLTPDELSSSFLNLLFWHMCLMILTAEARQGLQGGERGDNM